MIAGTGWTDEKGTKDNTTIDINTTGSSLDFKKVQFPVSDEYPLWVGNIRVSDRNKDKILGDSTVSYDAGTNTLTLNGAEINITEVEHGIRYEGQTPFIIKLESNSDNEIKTDKSTGASDGIYSEIADISIEGSGTLTIGRFAHYGINTDNDKNITITGVTVTVNGRNGGISSDGDLSISNATVYADETLTDNYALSAIHGNSIDIENSSVTAIAKAGQGRGISSASNVTIDAESIITAIGKEQAIRGTVINMVEGTGWTNTEGTAGQKTIQISSDGQDLSAYKKVDFPTVASQNDIIDDDDRKDDKDDRKAVKDDSTKKTVTSYKLPITGVE